MLHARRFTALLATLLFTQAMWAESGYACVMPAMNQSSAGAIAGMDMSGSDMADMDMPGMESEPGDAPDHDHVPCQLPWAVGGCPQMMSCAPVALGAPAQDLALSGTSRALAATIVVLTPPSETRAPELPPPKA